MKKLFTFLMTMVIAMVAANAADIKPTAVIGEGATSIAALEGKTFAIINKAESKALYGSNNQNLAYDVYANAFVSTNSGYKWKLVSLADDADESVRSYYRLRLVTPSGEGYNIWGSEGFLNSQPADGACSFILGLNNQNGQDILNGAVYDVQYEEGKGFSLKNIGTGFYQGANTLPAKAEEPAYFDFVEEVDFNYIPAVKDLLAEGEAMKANVTDEAAKEAYDAAIAEIDVDAIEGDGLAEAQAIDAALNALVKYQIAAGSNMTRAIVNAEINGAAGWTIEKPQGGNGPLLNNASFEYWAGNANPRDEASFDYYQVIEGLPNGIYTVGAEMYNSLNGEGGDYTVFAPTCGVYAKTGDAEVSKVVDVEGTELRSYTTSIEVTDGTLRIGVKNFTTPMAARWFVADNFKLTFEGVPATEEDMAPIVAEKAIAEALGVDVSAYGNQPIAAASVASVVNALKVAEYAQVHADYTQNAASLIPDFAQWEGDMVSNKGQHWDGTGTSTYYEQTGAQWGQDNWTNNKKTTVNLPKGKYVLYAAGRASAGDACVAYIKVNDEVREFPSKGDVGFGVATDGAAAFDPATATFANGNNGRGWEYRYIAFEVTADEGEDIALEIGGEATANHQWMSVTTPVLLTTADNAAIAKQILAADIEIAQAIVEAKAGVGEGLFMIPAEAFDTFEAAVNDAKGVNDNAEATAEDINAAIAALAAATEAYNSTPVNTPDPEKQYTFQLKLDNETPLYMNLSDGVKIQEEATPLSFVAAANAGQYYLDAEGELSVGRDGGNNWTMSTAAEKRIAWSFTALGNGEYHINNLVTAGRFVGTNGNETTAGTSCYCDKLPSNGNVVWIIEEYVVAVPTFAGIIEQTLTHPEAGVMGTETSEQTVKIAEAGEGLVDITFSGFKFPVLPFTVPEFTISNVTAETADDGSITYAAGNFQVAVPSGMMSAYYNGTLEGVQASAEATPLLKLVLSNATTDEIYFGADQDAIDAYKASFEPEPELAWVDLTDDMYHEWTGVDADAEITSNAPAFEKNIGNEVGGGTTVYGNGSVAAKTYAALADYKALKVTRSNETGGVPRLLFGRSEDNSSDFIEIADAQSPYIKATEDDGLTWIIDLDKIKAEKNGLANLNVIKVSWGGAATITSIQLGKVAEEEVPEIAISVERIVKQGYAAQTESFDFTEAAELLGVDAITEDMLRVVEADGTLNSDIAKYDGWFNKDGYAQTWGDNSFVCVKLFQAIEDGKYEICDMNNPQVDDEVTAKWAVVNGEKTVYININVKFIKKPIIGLTFDELNKKGDDVVVSFTSECGKSYEGLAGNVNMADILETLGVDFVNEVDIYAVQSDGSLDNNYKLGTTDGWRNADGDWQSWGADARFYVKVNFAVAENQIYEVGGMDGQNTEPAEYTATFAFVKKGTHDAVVLKVKLIYDNNVNIDGIDAAKAKANGKYLQNGKIVIVKNGKTYSVSGVEIK